MNIKHAALNSYVIVGGGTAGWITAAILGRLLGKTGATVTLVESPEIDTIGVGEATVPSFVDLLSILGISEQDFVKKTNATYKLGIKFTNWQTPGESYWHPFGNVGARIEGKPFFQQWLRSYYHGNTTPYAHYAPSAAIGEQHKFYIPDPAKPNNLSKLGYALHFDASLVAEYLADYAQQHGVKRVRAHVEHITQHSDDRIQSIQLKNGETIEGDFFVDCTGQRAILMNDTLKVNYTDWSQYLPVNAAAVVQSENTETLPPYTEAIAHEHGWRWRIPLQNRTGNGYVFCSNYCSDDNAIALLKNHVQGSLLTDPRIIRFTTGVREKSWHKNCVAIGLSSGFLEPLESTSIYLIMRGALNFVQMLPNESFAQATEDEYNRLMSIEYECLRDFIALHYCTSRRTDSRFWAEGQNRSIPDSLKTKMTLYQSQGRLVRNDIDLFQDDSWHAVLTGMGVIPNSYDPLVDSCDPKQIQTTLNNIEKSLQHSVAQLLSHKQFLQKLLAQ